MLLLDLPGCGQSHLPASLTTFDAKVWADDLNQIVQTLGVPKAHLIGHSAGGFMAALMLARAPELFRKAILLDPVGALGVRISATLTETYEQMRWSKDLVAAVIGSTIYNNDATSEFFRQIVVEDAFRAVQNIGMGIVHALNGLDIREECSKIEHSVMILHGEHDLLLPISESQAMSALMKNAKFEMIPGQGHCTNAENPELFVELVESFAFCH